MNLSMLSPQELKVVQMACEGKSARAIALELGRHEKTVQHHLYTVRQKLLLKPYENVPIAVLRLRVKELQRKVERLEAGYEIHGTKPATVKWEVVGDLAVGTGS